MYSINKPLHSDFEIDSSDDDDPFVNIMELIGPTYFLSEVEYSKELNRIIFIFLVIFSSKFNYQFSKVHQMKPDEFAAVLIEKLESVKRSQEVQEKLAYRLFNVSNFFTIIIAYTKWCTIKIVI